MARKLDDLFITGRPFTLDDGHGEPVEVWLQKMNPLEADKALRKANAAKARVLMQRADEDSDEWLEMYADIANFDKDALAEYLIGDAISEYRQSREAEMAAEEEWSKDGYLEGLRDSWEDELRDRPEEDEERQKCLAELRRFNDSVDPLIADERTRLIADELSKPDEELRRQAVRRFLDIRAGSVWVAEYNRYELAYGVRDPEKHDVYYFVGRDGEPDLDRVRRLVPETFTPLHQAYQQLIVPPAEGKDLPAAPSSSPPSEHSDEVATEQPSGPPAAVR